MKKIFTFLTIALFAAAMVACGEKDNTGNNTGNGGGNNNGPSLNDNNIVALNNDISAVESTVELFGQRYIADCESEHCHFHADINESLIGSTIDLSTTLDAECTYGITYEGDLAGEYYEIRQTSGYGFTQSYDQSTGQVVLSPLFDSGTLVTVNDNNGFSLTINGTLNDGKTFVARIFVAKEDIVHETEK